MSRLLLVVLVLGVSGCGLGGSNVDTIRSQCVNDSTVVQENADGTTGDTLRHAWFCDHDASTIAGKMPSGFVLERSGRYWRWRSGPFTGANQDRPFEAYAEAVYRAETSHWVAVLDSEGLGLR